LRRSATVPPLAAEHGCKQRSRGTRLARHCNMVTQQRHHATRRFIALALRANFSAPREFR